MRGLQTNTLLFFVVVLGRRLWLLLSNRYTKPSSLTPNPHRKLQPMLLGGSWVVISGVISRVTIVVTHMRRLITPLITTHEPPSRVSGYLSSHSPAHVSPSALKMRANHAQDAGNGAFYDSGTSSTTASQMLSFRQDRMGMNAH